MTSSEKGRFCGSCQKQVVDFSKMSDREVAMFFKKPSTGSVCGRFMEDQLNRDIEIPKKRIPWIKYFFQFALPAFLVSAKATAQGKVKIKDNSNNQEVVIIMKKDPNFQKEVTITTGCFFPKKKVFNDTITLPEVIITSYSTMIKGETFPTCTIVTKEPGKNTSEILPQLLSGCVGCVSVNQVSTVKKDTLFNKIKNTIIKETVKIFKIYPNPVQSGTSLNIEWKQPEEGEYMLQLFNQVGQLTFNKAMWIDKDARILSLEIPHVVAGNYFLRMTNKHSGKSYSEKIIIE